MCARHRVRAQSGQASPEWIALILLLSFLLFAALVALNGRIPGISLVRAIGARIICAVSLSDACGRDPILVATYGDEVASLVREHAPRIEYEPGMSALPVDFRRCRLTACGNGPPAGAIWRSASGQPVAAFVHVVDCRRAAAHATVAQGADCSGERAGNLYIQYWTYYADSATLRGVPVVGRKGYHADDWEGYQVRIGRGGTDARATSHHGYNYDPGARNWGSDAGIGPLRAATEAVGLRRRNGWGPETGWLHVSGGSHAGAAKRDDFVIRVTPRSRLHLIPAEPLAATSAAFAIDPPWLKPVYRDPESGQT